MQSLVQLSSANGQPRLKKQCVKPKKKNMKTKSLNLALLTAGLAISVASFGQGVYFGIGGGYGFAAAKMSIGPDHKGMQTTTNGNTTTSDTYTAMSASLGKGINLGLYGGYMFNKNVGAELGIAYLIGGSSTTTDEQDKSTSNPGFSSSNSDITKTIYKGSMLRLVPAIRIQCGEDKIHPYAVTGLIIGVAGKLTQEMQRTSNSSATGQNSTSDTYEDLYTYSGGVSIGFHGALGISYSISDKLGIFGELTGNYQSYSPSKQVYTTSTTNGVDNLHSLTTSQKETDYSSSYTTTNVVSPGSPTMASSIRIPFSSYGFNIGIHIALGGK
jgi:hypothetical protein